MGANGKPGRRPGAAADDLPLGPALDRPAVGADHRIGRRRLRPTRRAGGRGRGVRPHAASATPSSFGTHSFTTALHRHRQGVVARQRVAQHAERTCRRSCYCSICGPADLRLRRGHRAADADLPAAVQDRLHRRLLPPAVRGVRKDRVDRRAADGVGHQQRRAVPRRLARRRECSTASPRPRRAATLDTADGGTWTDLGQATSVVAAAHAGQPAAAGVRRARQPLRRRDRRRGGIAHAGRLRRTGRRPAAGFAGKGVAAAGGRADRCRRGEGLVGGAGDHRRPTPPSPSSARRSPPTRRIRPSRNARVAAGTGGGGAAPQTSAIVLAGQTAAARLRPGGSRFVNSRVVRVGPPPTGIPMPPPSRRALPA